MNMRLFTICATALVALGGYEAQAAPADEVRPAIEAANAQFTAAVAQHDGAAMAALYAVGGEVLPPGSEPVKGRAAIQKFWQGALDSGVAAIELKTVEIFGRGPTATEVGRYELRDAAGKSLDHGKYIVVWRRDGATWQLLRDMFSTNVVPAKK